MTRARTPLAGFRRDESGATLVEFALVIPLLLLILFGLIDFGRLSYHLVTAEKATQIAARVAAVRPPACGALPASANGRGTSTLNPPARFGTSCSAGQNICAGMATVTCSAATVNPTTTEVWNRINPLLPGLARENVVFTYAYDRNLNFLGGPVVPVVTVAIEQAEFDFISPLGALAGLAMGTAATGLGGTVPYPAISVSLPGEDLRMGGS